MEFGKQFRDKEIKIKLSYDKLLANGDVYVYDAASDKVILLNAGSKPQANTRSRRRNVP